MSTFDYTQEERQRDVGAGLYIPFYIEAPVEDLETSIGAEDSEVITVTCQVVDPGGDDIQERQHVRMILFTDDDYDTIDSAMSNIAIAATTGMIVEVNEAGVDIDFLTDDDGTLVLTFTDSNTGSETGALGFILPNGKFVEGGTILFAA